MKDWSNIAEEGFDAFWEKCEGKPTPELYEQVKDVLQFYALMAVAEQLWILNSKDAR